MRMWRIVAERISLIIMNRIDDFLNREVLMIS